MHELQQDAGLANKERRRLGHHSAVVLRGDGAGVSQAPAPSFALTDHEWPDRALVVSSCTWLTQNS